MTSAKLSFRECLLTRTRLQEVFGGNAVSDEYHIGRHVANLFVTQTYEGQSDIHGKFRQGSLTHHDVLKHEQLLSSDVQSLVFKLSVKRTYSMKGQALDLVDKLTDAALMLCKIAETEHTKQTKYMIHSPIGTGASA